MSTFGKVLGVSILGLATAGCATKIDDIDPKLNKYHSNDTPHLNEKEARLLWELEFDKNHDGRISDEETLKAFDYLSTLPDTWTRDEMFKALVEFRKETLDNEKKAANLMVGKNKIISS